MKKIIIYIVSLTALFAFSSCEDFLDKRPETSVGSEDAITTMDDANLALNGVYAHFKTGSYYGRNMVVVPDIMTDAVLAIVGYSNTYGILHQWTFNAGDSDIEGFWFIMYATIANASFLLEKIDDVPGDPAVIGNIKGQALLARAIAHFDLVRMFAKTYDSTTASTDLGVPVITKFEIGQPSRNTVEEVYTRIILDATEALSLITDDNADAVTFTKGAANAFLARVYLTMKNYDKAIEHSSAVIANTKYSLAEIGTFNSMFLNDRGNEIIWKVAITAADAANLTPGRPYYNNAQGNPNPDYMPSDEMFGLFTTADVRRSTYFRNAQTVYGWTGTLVYKYPTNPLFASTTNANGANMPKVFRLAEQYLIRAEAYAEKGGVNEALALADLNTLRSKRITGYTNTSLTGNALKDGIWVERRKELAYEGHYWFDLKRKKLGFTRDTQTPQPNAVPGMNFDKLTVTLDNHRWLFPIPQSEINANSNINANNPGY